MGDQFCSSEGLRFPFRRFLISFVFFVESSFCFSFGWGSESLSVDVSASVRLGGDGLWDGTLLRFGKPTYLYLGLDRGYLMSAFLAGSVSSGWSAGLDSNAVLLWLFRPLRDAEPHVHS